MPLFCEENIVVDYNHVCFGDIEDVLKNSCERVNSCGGTIKFTTSNGVLFIPGKYRINFLNKHTMIMCMDSVDPVKIREYMMRTDCSDFRDPHLINRYDWKRLKYGCDSSTSILRDRLLEQNIEVKRSLLIKLKQTLGKEYHRFTYVVKGNGKFNQFSKNDISLIKVELQDDIVPKTLHLIKQNEDESVIGFVYNMYPQLQGDHEYGALLEDYTTKRHFALILSDEHIDNTLSKSKAECELYLPTKFTGVVDIKDFLYSS